MLALKLPSKPETSPDERNKFHSRGPQPPENCRYHIRRLCGARKSRHDFVLPDECIRSRSFKNCACIASAFSWLSIVSSCCLYRTLLSYCYDLHVIARSSFNLTQARREPPWRQVEWLSGTFNPQWRVTFEVWRCKCFSRP